MHDRRNEGAPSLEEYGLDIPTLKRMYSDWAEKGVPKSKVERRYLGTAHHHGKLFSRLVREHLGFETEQLHPLRARVRELEEEVRRLQTMLARLGVPTPPPERSHSDKQEQLFGDELDP